MRNDSFHVSGAARCGARCYFLFGLAGAWLGFCMTAQSADRYWVSPSNSVWSLAANWSATSGGAGGAAVPGAGDRVFFNATKQGDCQIDASAVTLGSLSVSSYTGRLDAAVFHPDVTVTGAVTLASGLNGKVYLGNGRWTIGGNFSYSGMGGNPRTMDPGASTVVMTGSNVTLSATYYRLLNNLMIASNAVVNNTGAYSTRIIVDNRLDVFGTLNVGYVDPDLLRVCASGRVIGPGTVDIHYCPGIALFESDGELSVATLRLFRPDGGNYIPVGHYEVANFQCWGETYTYTWYLTNGVWDIDGNIWMHQHNANGAVTLDCRSADIVRVGGSLTNSASAAVTVYKSKFLGTVTMTGATHRVIDFNRVIQQPSIIIDKPLGSVKLLSALTNTPAMTVSNGTIDFNGQRVRTSGNLTVAPGGQVVAAGLAGSVIGVGSDLTLSGTPDARLDLAASDTWSLSVAGTGVVHWARVANADASGGNMIVAWNSRDLGGNINWRFVQAGTVLQIR